METLVCLPPAHQLQVFWVNIMSQKNVKNGKARCFFYDFQGPSRTIQNKQSVYKMEGRHHIHKHVHDTLALPFCSWFMLVQDIFCNNLECQATWVCWRGLWWLPLQYVGLAMGILLRKCVCRPCGFCGGDDRNVFKASNILKPAPVQEKKSDDHYFGPVYPTTSVGRYFMKPDCQMHKMQKFEICKDCLRDFKKFHSE